MAKLRSYLSKRKIAIFLLLFLGLLVRLYFVDKYIGVSGDLLLYADWGQKFWEYGAREFYFIKDWYYAPPNYPPLISLIYAFAYWIYDKKYLLPQIYSVVRLYPSEFIVYFYEHGYIFLLKLPAILADLGISGFIYLLVFKITQNRVRSLFAMAFYLFNPVSVMLSSVWGQTDSLIALLALMAFVLLQNKNFILSLPLYFISIYIKPNWIYLLPFFIFLVFLVKPKIKHVAMGVFLAFLIFLITTFPFAKTGLPEFSYWLISERILPTASIAQKASVSAFNFYTTFLRIDYDLDSTLIFGIPGKLFGIGSYLMLNVFAFFYIHRKKDLSSLMFVIFVIGFGCYLFLTNMLERYFFPAFVPLVILMFANPRLFLAGFLINLTVLGNLIYSFFRRKVGAIADFFSMNDFLLIKLASFINLVSYIFIIKRNDALALFKPGTKTKK